MRRLVVAFAVRDVAEVLHDPSFEKIESLEVLSFLKSSPADIALVCRLGFKDPATKIEEVFADMQGGSDRPRDLQVLEEEPGGTYICFLRRRRIGLLATGPDVVGGYLSLPYEISDGQMKATFLGSVKEIEWFLDAAEKAGLTPRVVSITDAKFSSSSPLGALTEKQRRVILSAFKLGYYDVPRRVSSEELARRLKIREPTLVMHRRKAERRILAALTGEP